MAECVAHLPCGASSSIQPCVGVAHSCNFRNAPAGVYLCNPLGCNRRSSRLLSVNISLGPLDFSSKRRLSAPVCVISNNSSKEPIQRSVEAEEKYDSDSAEEINAENPSTSPIDFASSLVSAVSSDSSTEIGRPESKKRDRKRERDAYLLAAIASSIGFTTMAAGAVYYRFYWQMQVCISLDITVQFFNRASCEKLIRLSRVRKCQRQSIAMALFAISVPRCASLKEGEQLRDLPICEEWSSSSKLSIFFPPVSLQCQRPLFGDMALS